jgi:hypothetical protein
VATSSVTLEDVILEFVTSELVAVKFVTSIFGVVIPVVIRRVLNVIVVAKIEPIVILLAKKFPAVSELVNQPIPDVIPVANTPVAALSDVVEILVINEFVTVSLVKFKLTSVLLVPTKFVDTIPPNVLLVTFNEVVVMFVVSILPELIVGMLAVFAIFTFPLEDIVRIVVNVVPLYVSNIRLSPVVR